MATTKVFKRSYDNNSIVDTNSKTSIKYSKDFLFCAIMVVISCLLALSTLAFRSTAYATHQTLAKQTYEIQQLQKDNNELSIQISELSSYDRITAKANELGLKLQQENVKVVK